MTPVFTAVLVTRGRCYLSHVFFQYRIIMTSLSVTGLGLQSRANSDSDRVWVWEQRQVAANRKRTNTGNFCLLEYFIGSWVQWTDRQILSLERVTTLMLYAIVVRPKQYHIVHRNTGCDNTRPIFSTIRLHQWLSKTLHDMWLWYPSTITTSGLHKSKSTQRTMQHIVSKQLIFQQVMSSS